jgi:hypothetical protein
MIRSLEMRFAHFSMQNTMSDLVDRVVESMQAAELCWLAPGLFTELARAAIEAVRTYEPVPRRSQPSPDKFNDAFDKATRCQHGEHTCRQRWFCCARSGRRIADKIANPLDQTELPLMCPTYGMEEVAKHTIPAGKFVKMACVHKNVPRSIR